MTIALKSLDVSLVQRANHLTNVSQVSQVRTVSLPYLVAFVLREFDPSALRHRNKRRKQQQAHRQLEMSQASEPIEPSNEEVVKTIAQFDISDWTDLTAEEVSVARIG